MIGVRGFPFWMTLFPKVLLALVINVLDGVYHKIAVWLNDKGIWIFYFKFLLNYINDERRNHILLYN